MFSSLDHAPANPQVAALFSKPVTEDTQVEAREAQTRAAVLQYYEQHQQEQAQAQELEDQRLGKKTKSAVERADVDLDEMKQKLLNTQESKRIKTKKQQKKEKPSEDKQDSENKKKRKRKIEIDEDEQDEFDELIYGSGNKELASKYLKAFDEDHKIKKVATKDSQATDQKKKKGKKAKSTKEPFDPKVNNIFIGNVPIPKDKNLEKTKKALKHFILENIPGLKVGPIRFRSIALSKRERKKVGVIKKDFNSKRDNMNAYVVLFSEDDCQKALQLNGKVFQDKHLVVNLASNDSFNMNKSVFLGNVAFEATEETFYKLFEDCNVSSIRLIRDNETGMGLGYGYATFAEEEDVRLALKKDGSDINGRKLRVSVCIKKLANKSKKEGLINKYGKKVAIKNSSDVKFGAKEHRVKEKKKKAKTQISGLQGADITKKEEKGYSKKEKKMMKSSTPKQWRNSKEDKEIKGAKKDSKVVKTSKTSKASGKIKLKKPKHLKRKLAQLEAQGISSQERAKYAAKKALEAKLENQKFFKERFEAQKQARQKRIEKEHKKSEKNMKKHEKNSKKSEKNTKKSQQKQ